MSTPCQHRRNHKVEANVVFLEDVARFVVDFKVACFDCGQPFQFLGLPKGLDITGGATVSADHEEARLAIHPANEEPPSVIGLKGFSVTVKG